MSEELTGTIIPKRYRDNSKLPPGDSVQDFWMRLTGLMLKMDRDTCALVLEMRNPLAHGIAKIVQETLKPGWLEPDGLLLLGLHKKTVVKMMAGLAPDPRWAPLANEIIDGLKHQPEPHLRTMVLIDSDQCCVADTDPRATAFKLAALLPEPGSKPS